MSFPIPLVLEPSAVWAGSDGNWSTWEIQVGTPQQPFNILPSTSHGEIWIPVTEGCSWLPSTIDCGQLRGVGQFQGTQSLGYQNNASSTWQQIGIYELSVGGDLFNTSQSGLYGFDDISFGDNESMSKQVVAGIATQDFWLGSIGLDAQSSDFPVLEESAPSLIDAMKAQNRTPSASYGFAVGASYDSYAGSLIMGGYDKTLFQDSGVEIPISRNQTRSLITSVQSIVATNTLQGTVSLTHDAPSLSVALDSGVSQLWLPRAICDNLADILNLTYDSSTELYLIGEAARSRLLDLSPEFTFTLAASADSNETASVVLPYAALDLEVGIPTYNSSRNYFPIRRAPEESLLVLGRAFLQEAYLVVDWQRDNFTIGQINHERTSEPEIVPILPPSETSDESSGLSAGVIAGIVVGVVVLLTLIALAVYFLWWRKRSRPHVVEAETSDEKPYPPSPYPVDSKVEETTAELSGSDALLAEASSNPVHELHQEQVAHQLMSEPIYELPAERVEGELDAKSVPKSQKG